MKPGRRMRWIVGVIAVLVAAAAIGFWQRPVRYLNEIVYLRMDITGVESHSVEVAGHRIHYDAEGPKDGSVVVLVHGLGGRAEDWLNLAPYLVKAGYRVYMPDLLGYGRSDKPAAFSYSMRDEAAVVVGFLDALGLKQVDLGGWSMGGWIVQLVAGEHPERVKRLILFDAAGLHVQPDWDTRLFTPATAAQLNQLEALLTPHPPWIPGFVARDILRVSSRDAWVIQRAMASMLTGSDATNRVLPELKMPVLIAWGAEDRILPLSQAETIHKLAPQSQLDVFPGCGHLAPSHCTKQVGPKVVAFLKQ